MVVEANAGVTAAIIATAVAAQQQRVLAPFVRAEALSPERAIAFAPEKRGDEKVFESLVRRGRLVEAAPGLYWLKQPEASARAAWLLLVLGLVSLGVLVAMFLLRV